ncbi:uncharacterized protein LOC135165980 [Diachasmimorpha longicaudata]|uniref:uncharacterized protein LOC135165980 n=1 Tax=Diachasmimorpha longicaudata TaxID=58733 RepID=UPI0030B90BD0
MFMTIRTELMMRDESKQISAAEKIHKELCRRKDRREEFMEDLLRFSVAHALCDVMGTTNEKLLKPVLESLSVLSTTKIFFENNLGNLSLDKIMKTSFFLLRKRTQFEEILFHMLLTVEKILVSAEMFQVDLVNLCEINMMLEYLLDFEAVGNWQMKPKLCSVRIFKQIIHVIGIPLDDKSSEMVRKLFEDHLKCLEQVIKVRGNPNCPIALTAIKHICEINCKAVWFCSTIRDSYDSDIYVVPPPKPFHDALIVSLMSTASESLIKSVLPHFHQLPPTSNIIQYIRESFLTFLNQLYDLDVPTHILSRTLATEGYLMFLFQEGRSQFLQKMKWFPNTVSHVLAKVLTNLAVKEGSLGVDATAGDVEGFRDSLAQGIISTIESEPMKNSSAFLTLIYFHHKATKKEIEVPLEVIVEKILHIPEAHFRVPEVKVLWFILAKLMLRVRERPKGLSEAVSKLFGIVKDLGIGRCFLDDEEVVKSVLVHPLGHEIRRDVLKMWIERYGEVENVWDDFSQDNLIFCLWKLIETSPDNFVRKAQKCLEVIISKKNLEKDMKYFFLQRIPDIIADFNNSKSHNFISILELFEKLTPEDFPGEFGPHCAPNIIRILLIEGLDTRVKCLLMQFCSRILSSSGRQSDPRVAKIFVEKPDIIREICTQAFSWESEDALSGVCLRVLTILLVTQQKFKLKSKETLVLEEMQLYSPLKRSLVVSLEGVRFLTILLSESVEEPVVKFEDFTGGTRRDEVIYGIYDRVIVLQGMCGLEHWIYLYNCLSTILTFCEGRKFRKTLALCCDSPAHFFLVFFATQKLDTSPQFFSFLNNWLTISISIRTLSIQCALSSREKRTRDKIEANLPFGRTLMFLNVYINHLRGDANVDQAVLASLRTLIEKII